MSDEREEEDYTATLTLEEWALLLAALVTYVTPGTPTPSEMERTRMRAIAKNVVNQMPKDSVAWWAGGLLP